MALGEVRDPQDVPGSWPPSRRCRPSTSPMGCRRRLSLGRLLLALPGLPGDVLYAGHRGRVVVVVFDKPPTRHGRPGCLARPEVGPN